MSGSPTSEASSTWFDLALCAQADPDLFFPESFGAVTATDVAEAVAICGRCQVRELCLQRAVLMGCGDGIWGGTTPDERVKLRRRDRARFRSRM